MRESEGEREKPEKLQCGTCQSVMIRHHRNLAFSILDLIEEAFWCLIQSPESFPALLVILVAELNSKLEHVLIRTGHYTLDYMHRSLLLRLGSRAGKRY